MKRVMIVDDAAFTRLALRMILEKHDYEVVAEAENGEDAVGKYLSLRPDIVTMDIMMPEMNGIDALRKIRAEDAAAKVLMITSNGQESLMRDAVTAGARGFLLKPFSEKLVLRALDEM